MEYAGLKSDEHPFSALRFAKDANFSDYTDEIAALPRSCAKEERFRGSTSEDQGCLQCWLRLVSCSADQLNDQRCEDYYRRCTANPNHFLLDDLMKRLTPVTKYGIQHRI